MATTQRRERSEVTARSAGETPKNDLPTRNCLLLGNKRVKRYIIEVWETRSFEVHVEAENEEDAKEIAVEEYDELSHKDEFVSVEFREFVEKPA